MKLAILLYISSTTDSELEFVDGYLPETLPRRLHESGIDGPVFYSVSPAYAGKLSGTGSCFVRSGGDDVEFWKDIFGRSGSDHICKISGESPFLDPRVIRDMIGLHVEQRAEFTYSENLPPGISCEVVSRELIASLPDVSEKTLPLSQVIRANINQFDIELYYREPDIRDRRISFLLGNPRDRRIMENLYRLSGGIPSYDSLKDLIDGNPGALFVGPSYLEIELTGACDLDCLFCFRKTLPSEHPHLDVGVVAKLLEQMRAFGLPYNVCFGGSGEPLMHPQCFEIMALARLEPMVERVLVETNGIAAGDNYRAFVLEAGAPVTTIVNINATDAASYLTLHGGDCFDAVHRNILALSEAAPDRLFIQIMKINETEPSLDAYYDYWEKLKIPVILQKQNTYLGRIQDRRYSDLSPLERIPCWHLQRDLYVTSDGRVCFCKQDVDGAAASGTVGTDTLMSIWEKKREHFIRDYRREYPSLPDCASCDEWYTFNF